jgi:hypothetical protein
VGVLGDVQGHDPHAGQLHRTDESKAAKHAKSAICEKVGHSAYF